MVGMNPPHSPYRSLDDCEEEDFNLYRSQPLDSLLVRPNVDLKMKKAESVRYYFASVTGVDRAFGQILARPCVANVRKIRRILLTRNL